MNGMYCPKCEGEGRIKGEICPLCQGSTPGKPKEESIIEPVVEQVAESIVGVEEVKEVKVGKAKKAKKIK